MESALYQPVPDDLTLIETMRYDPDFGPVRGLLHLRRMARTARLLDLPFDMMQAAAHLDGGLDAGPERLRLTFSRLSGMQVERAPMPAPASLWNVAIAADRINSRDPWLQVKTSRRALYDQSRAALPDNLQEWLFLNEKGELAEGSITNIFLQRGDTLLTPPTSSGCLPGVLREELLDEGRAKESVLTPPDLLDGHLFVGNSLRDLIPARLVTG